MKIRAWLSLFRVLNLFFVALTQWSIFACVIQPVIRQYETCHLFDPLELILLIVSTLFITAAGYIINDYFDVQTDEINRPDKMIIDRLIARRSAMAMHIVLNFAGLGIAFYLANRIGFLPAAFLHFIVATFLWYYSTYFKKQYLSGNILVGLMTASVVISVPLFHFSCLTEVVSSFHYSYCLLILIYFSWFAFIVSLIREIVKDMEDVEGDRSIDCKTVPIVSGISFAKKLCVVIIGICLISFLYPLYFLFTLSAFGAIGYISIFIIGLLLWILKSIWHADKVADFRSISSLLKWVMLFGILFLWYLKFIPI